MTGLTKNRFASATRDKALGFFSRERGRSGLAAIEFALIGPMIVMALVCTCDLGLAIYHNMQVESAAEAGAQWAALYGYDVTKISTAVTASTSGFSVNASPAPVENCDCPSAGGVSQVTCGTTCADGTLAGTYVTVSAAGSYTTIIPYPMLPNSFALSSTSVVRVQ